MNAVILENGENDGGQEITLNDVVIRPERDDEVEEFALAQDDGGVVRSLNLKWCQDAKELVKDKPKNDGIIHSLVLKVGSEPRRLTPVAVIHQNGDSSIACNEQIENEDGTHSRKRKFLSRFAPKKRKSRGASVHQSFLSRSNGSGSSTESLSSDASASTEEKPPKAKKYRNVIKQLTNLMADKSLEDEHSNHPHSETTLLPKRFRAFPSRNRHSISLKDISDRGVPLKLFRTKPQKNREERSSLKSVEHESSRNEKSQEKETAVIDAGTLPPVGADAKAQKPVVVNADSNPTHSVPWDEMKKDSESPPLPLKHHNAYEHKQSMERLQSKKRASVTWAQGLPSTPSSHANRGVPVIAESSSGSVSHAKELTVGDVCTTGPDSVNAASEAMPKKRIYLKKNRASRSLPLFRNEVNGKPPHDLMQDDDIFSPDVVVAMSPGEEEQAAHKSVHKSDPKDHLIEKVPSLDRAFSDIFQARTDLGFAVSKSQSTNSETESTSEGPIAEIFVPKGDSLDGQSKRDDSKNEDQGRELDDATTVYSYDEHEVDEVDRWFVAMEDVCMADVFVKETDWLCEENSGVDDDDDRRMKRSSSIVA